jgi:hypothetical protein
MKPMLTPGSTRLDPHPRRPGMSCGRSRRASSPTALNGQLRGDEAFVATDFKDIERC